MNRLRILVGRRLGFPPALSSPAPLLWLLLALSFRALGAERWETVAVGRCLKTAIRAVRA